MADDSSGLVAMPYRGREAPMTGDRPGGNWRRSVFGVATSWPTYARILYLLLSFPIVIGAWSALVVLVAAGAGMSITIVGVPALIATMYLWCSYVDLERLLSNLLLGTKIRPLPFQGERAERWLWPRIRARLRNRYTWRAFAYALVVRFATGVAGFVVVLATLAFALQFALVPLNLAFGADENQVAGWKLDTWADAAIAVPIGLLLILPALHICDWAGRIAGRVNTLMLQSDGSPGEPAVTALDRAATAAVVWPGLLGGVTSGARERSLQVRTWGAHAALYLAVVVGLVFINGMYSPDTWWVLWPAWGWGIAIALHTGYLLRGHLGAHAAAFLVTNTGLFIIDSAYADSTWFYWPLLAWAIALAAHAYVFYGFTRIEEPPLRLAGAPAFAAAPSVPPPAGIAVDREMRTVRAAGEPVEVTPREFDLLVLLTGHPGRPFSREELLDQIWKDDYDVTDRTIDTHVQRLRKKLGNAAECIQTVWGVGYRYQP